MRLKFISSLVLILLLPFTAAAADLYKIDQAHSDVGFRIRHLISTVTGSFNDFEGTIRIDFDDLAASSVKLSIDAASIDTRNQDRDKHLRSADFFRVDTFPNITFSSTSIKRTGKDSFAVTGDFTMHGVTRTITLPVTYLGQVTDPWGAVKTGFSLTTTLDRKDYGIVWNKALDSGGFILGDEVTVEINLEAARTTD